MKQEVKSKKARVYESEEEQRLARKYRHVRVDRINPAKLREYEQVYLHSPKAEVERFLDELENERQRRGE